MVRYKSKKKICGHDLIFFDEHAWEFPGMIPLLCCPRVQTGPRPVYRKSKWAPVDPYKGAFTLHPRSRSEHPSPSSDAIETTELLFRVYTDPSPCPRLLPRMSLSQLVATCNDFLGHGRTNSSEVVQCACSKPPVHVVAIAGCQK